MYTYIYIRGRIYICAYTHHVHTYIGYMQCPTADKGAVSVPADFLVWAASEEARFLRNKFVFATWDVDELKARKSEIEQGRDLTLGLNGFPHTA